MKRDRMRDLPAAAIRLCLLACVLMLTACGSVPPIPPQKDAAVGIFPGERPKSPLAKVPAGPEVKAVAVLSENTLANTAWKRKIHDNARAMARGDRFGNAVIASAGAELFDPDYPLAWVAASLKRYFGSVEQVPIAQLPQASGDVLAIVDIYAYPADDSVARIKVSFFDSELRHIADASGEDAQYFNKWARTGGATAIAEGYRRENEVLMRALRKFDSSLAQQVSGPPAQAAGGYDACLQRALAAQDPQLRVAAMAACDAAR
ncbi:hypothetical protein B7P02_12330 [Bordetella bronchiseptica]|uniref:hypothetical protein n=1 Tax=Bordetella bronchiseptica TaxID=518 RepID=UPI000528AFE3|nr:hypothetical protein [Bordetella bronchiseptica]AUL15633.1 hypothetical protein BTL45_12390 [Bordetella bronchiseptica]AWP58734.1 hypothetical protein B7P02_12330 [Bordetella bronchiseptica]